MSEFTFLGFSVVVDDSLPPNTACMFDRDQQQFKLTREQYNQLRYGLADVSVCWQGSKLLEVSLVSKPATPASYSMWENYVQAHMELESNCPMAYYRLDDLPIDYELNTHTGNGQWELSHAEWNPVALTSEQVSQAYLLSLASFTKDLQIPDVINQPEPEPLKAPLAVKKRGERKLALDKDI